MTTSLAASPSLALTRTLARPHLRTWFGVLLGLALATSAGCGGNTGGGPSGDAGPNGDSGPNADSGPNGDSGLPPGATAEVCNGLDDDLDGKTDDIDANSDGFCDCLNVAMLGIPGTWGAGSAFTTWLQEKGSYVVDLGDADLTTANLSGFDVIIINDVSDDGVSGHGIERAYSAAEIEALTDFVQAGGGVITMTGYWDTNEHTNVNALLAPFGMSYDPTPYLAVSGTTPVEVWHATHPIAANISSIGVDNGYEPQGPGTVVASDQGSGATVGLAQSGTTAVGSGKVFVWGDEWVAYDELWVGHPEYQILQFWINVVNWLTPVDRCEIDVIIVD